MRPWAGTSRRFAALDMARGLALGAMVAYHFSWDLAWFGLVEWPVATSAGWQFFARAIAASFLMIVGISFAVATARGLRRVAFWRRLVVIVAAAGAISFITMLVLPDAPIRFGILHAIAASSVILLGIRHAPTALIALMAVGLWALAFLGPVSAAPYWLFWTGMIADPPASVDFVPVVPWAGFACAGLALGRWLMPRLPERLWAWQPHHLPARLVTLAGRHSLLVYLLHQPALVAAVAGVVALGLVPSVDERAFVERCTLNCAADFAISEGKNVSDTCVRACACTLDNLKSNGVWARLLRNPGDVSTRRRLQEHFDLCLDVRRKDPAHAPASN